MLLLCVTLFILKMLFVILQVIAYLVCLSSSKPPRLSTFLLLWSLKLAMMTGVRNNGSGLVRPFAGSSAISQYTMTADIGE